MLSVQHIGKRGSNGRSRWPNNFDIGAYRHSWNSMQIRPLTLVLSIVWLICIADPVVAADVFQGRDIYMTHCESCHGVDGESMVPGTPSFADGDTLFRTDSELFTQILAGNNLMPAYRGFLSDAEIRDVIAYIRSLQ